MDRRLARIEARLDQLGVDHLTIAGFITVWNAAPEHEKQRLRALGDRRLLREMRTLPAAARDREDRAANDTLIDGAVAAVHQSVKSAVAWVGDDIERARAVLTVEEAQDHPRSTLITALLAILEPA